MLHALRLNIIRNFYVCKYSIKRVAHHSLYLKLEKSDFKLNLV